MFHLFIYKLTCGKLGTRNAPDPQPPTKPNAPDPQPPALRASPEAAAETFDYPPDPQSSTKP